ncbi:MAG: acyltransferase [Azoarcus sp.]|jgi:peptidoglycan/LPS O-acetylase OafA/YrhL|nr:acyltransferase [Azoarcus sp.]
MKPAIRYRPDIDGLRAVAVLAVVINHAAPSLLPGGFLGVDIFFVISGYLISQIIFRELQENSFRFASFYARRVRRLFPALMTVLLAVLIFGAFALFSDEYAQLARHAYWSMAFLENFRLMNESGYFDAASYTKPLMHLWSLSVEEQFYLAWPFSLVLAWRLGKQRAIVGLLSLLLTSSWLVTLALGKEGTEIYFHPFTRVWELLLGAALAHFHAFGVKRGGKSRVHQLAAPLSLLGFAAVLLGLYPHDWKMTYPGPMTLIPVAGTLLLLASHAACPANRLLALKPLVWVGFISYPLYLWHWPVFSFIRIMESGKPSPVFICVGALLSFLLAALTWRFVELPIRNMHTMPLKKSGKAVLSGLAASMAVLFLATCSIAQFDLSPQFTQSSRFSPEIMADLTLPFMRDSQCLDMLPKDVMDLVSYCRLEGKTSPMIAIIGDSHAGYLFAGFSKFASEHGYSTLVVGKNGCLPLEGFTTSKATKKREACTKVIDAIFDLLEQIPHITHVVMVTRGPLSITGKGFGLTEPGFNWTDAIAATRDGSNRPPEQIFEHGIENSFLRLKAHGLKVAYLLQVPELGVRPQECLSSRPLTLTRSKTECTVPYPVYRERMQHYRELIAKVNARHGDLTIVDPEPLFCDRTKCAGYRDGQLFYYDDDHLSITGAYHVAKLILDVLALPVLASVQFKPNESTTASFRVSPSKSFVHEGQMQ